MAHSREFPVALTASKYWNCGLKRIVIFCEKATQPRPSVLSTLGLPDYDSMRTGTTVDRMYGLRLHAANKAHVQIIAIICFAMYWLYSLHCIVSQKEIVTLFYICDNLVRSHPILPIFDRNTAGIWNEHIRNAAHHTLFCVFALYLVPCKNGQI